MKTFTITEEQVKEYNLEHLFKTIETHRWYVVRHTSMQDAFIFLQEEGMERTHGFNHLGEWTDTYNNENLYSNYRGDILRLATEDELESLLIAEAERRGVWNKPMVNVSGFKQTTNEDYYVGYTYETDKLWSRFGLVYNAGEWATLIVEDRLSRIEKHLGL
jgi:hypothetical protein